MAQLIDIQPARSIGISRRALTGRVQVSAGGGLNFESSLERDWLLALDFSPDVISVREQPFTLTYESNGRTSKYTPDVLVQHVARSGAAVCYVYEVKFREDLIAEWQTLKPRFKACIAYCRARGWRFKIVTEKHIRGPFLKNAKFLRRYRSIDENPLVCKQLQYTFAALGETTPEALLAASYWDEEARLRALPQLWRMVANRVIQADLSDELTMTTRVWMNLNG